jgi:hypothetical protein
VRLLNISGRRENELQGQISPVEAPAKAFYYVGEIDHDHTAWKSVDVRDRLQLPYERSQSQAACPTEEKALSAREHDLFSVPQKENKAFILAELRFRVAEVDNTAPISAKEDRGVESSLKAPERASKENATVGEMYERRI